VLKWIRKLAIDSGLARHDPTVKARLGPNWRYLRNYSSDVLDAPVRDLELLESFEQQVQKARRSGENLIDLSQGMPDLQGISGLDRIVPDEHATSIALRAYPPAFGIEPATTAVARKIKNDTGIEYDPAKEILICNGASQGIAHALEAFASPGDRIVMFDPCYLFYPWLALTRGLRIRRVPGPAQRNGRLDPILLERAMRGSRLILVNSPANPDGSMLHPEDMQLISEFASRHGTIIISDEVYASFCWDSPFQSMATVSGARKHTIIVSSVSKSHGLPGLRLGWCAGPQELIRPMGMLMSIRVPCVNVQAQLALPALLESEGSFATARKDTFRSRREAAIKSATDSKLFALPPKGGFYLWVDTPDRFGSGYEFASWALEKSRIVIMPGEPFGPAGARKVRLSWGVSSEDFSTAMDRITL
jgi:aspartate/methionine/tyrosine aminotransferase